MSAIVVTGTGLRCSVGQDAVRSAVAVRAGISRFAAWPPGSGADPDAEVVGAAAVDPDLGDAGWTAKFDALAVQPLLEALDSAGLGAAMADGSRSRWSLHVSLPAAGRPGLDPDDAAEFESLLAANDVVPVPVPALHVSRRGHASVLGAIAAAVREMEEEDLEFCVVGGVDSLLETQYLEHLLGEGRLKTSDRPAGLVPGEAGAFVVLESAARATARGAAPLARMGAVATGTERDGSSDAAPVRGRALARVLREALAGAGCAPGAIARTLVDLNGERWRFQEWAHASTTALSALPPDRILWHPADALGDVGAATGGAHLALAAQALRGGWARGEGILVSNASDSGERAAVCVSAAGR